MRLPYRGGPGAYPLGLCLPTEQRGEGSPFRLRLRLVAKPVNSEGPHICICGSTARPLARRHRDRTGRCHCLGRPFRIPQCPGRPHWSLATAGLARDTRPPGTKSGFLLSLVSSFFKKQQVLTYRERSISWRGWEPVRGPRLFLYPHPPGTISTPELTPPTHRTQRNSIFISDAYDG